MKSCATCKFIQKWVHYKATYYCGAMYPDIESEPDYHRHAILFKSETKLSDVEEPNTWCQMWEAK